MRHGVSLGVLVVLVVTAGCVESAGGGPQTLTAQETASPTMTASEMAPPTKTGPAQVQSLPSPTGCSIGALPRPTTKPNASTYPTAPEKVTPNTVTNWTLAFAEAYERNRVIARESGDEDMNLREVTVYVEVTNSTRLEIGQAVVVHGQISTMYESGAHGDQPVSAGYFVNDTIVRRISQNGSLGIPDPTDGKILLDCRD